MTSIPDQTQHRVARFLAHRSIHSLEEYARWLRFHVRYRSDPGRDRWSAPLETIKEGGGDCEDLAFLNASAAGVLGYEAVVVIFWEGKQGHAVCIIRDGDRYVWFNNTRFQKTVFRSAGRLIRHLSKHFNLSKTHVFPEGAQPWQKSRPDVPDGILVSS